MVLGQALASLHCLPKLSESERGVYAASPPLLPQLSLNSNLVGSFSMKRPDRRRAEAALFRAAKAEDRAPTDRQVPNAPFGSGIMSARLTEAFEAGRVPALMFQ